ncbi:MAG: hypothetical protein PHY32_01420 [Candidatus Pacebacteria bacterium]|nr:hypothetical protein [Candidatus Paceibacterota bacterium]
MAPFLVFLPTGIISCILLLSGKKGTMKIITGLLSTIIDTLIPGLNILPITSIAVFVIMKPEGGKLLNINSQQMSKIMKSVKKFIK